jgi:large subunit ribosomal protein L33
MAKKTGQRETIKMKSTESPHVFTTTKNKRNTPDRLQLKRYDPVVRKHVLYKESR